MRKLLLLILLLGTFVHAQTATVMSSHNTTVIPYDGQAVPVHLAWGPPAPVAGWTLFDYCVSGSGVSGQEHGIQYRGCGTHASTTTLDVYPPIGPHFWVVWAEFKSTDGTKIALSSDSNEASCDLEVLSQTATLITYYCKGQTAVIMPPSIAGVWK